MNETVRIEPRAEVLAAISKAMASVKKVVKEGKNAHDGYNFASIDDFLAMVNPICADAGLIFPETTSTAFFRCSNDALLIRIWAAGE